MGVDAAILRGLRSLDEVSPSPKFTSRVMCQLDADYQAAPSAEVADRHGSGLLKVWFAPQGKALVRVAGIAALVTICVTAWRWGAPSWMKRSDVMTLPGSIFIVMGPFWQFFLVDCIVCPACGVHASSSNSSSATLQKTPDSIGIGFPCFCLQRLLEADLQQRNALLPPEGESSRLFWQKKLQEYEKLEPEERQRRLQEAQWHWYLMLIMRTEGPARSRVLAQIPEEDRPLIENRLQIWEALPEDIQQESLRICLPCDILPACIHLRCGGPGKSIQRSSAHGCGF